MFSLPQSTTDQNKKSDGRDFERRVHDLLALKGVQNLTREKQLAYKKIDLYFEVTVFGARKRYAVECKDYNGTLRQSAISSIYGSYTATFDANDITDLLIVSNARLGPSAQSYVDTIPRLSYLTYDGLRNSLIDFRNYLGGLKTRFSTDSAFNYYVAPQGSIRDSTTGALKNTPNERDPDLLALLLKELRQPDLPFVVLGAYGIGKTTLAKRLFLILLDAWEREQARPMPIYISLDRMMREQSLEGLLGTMFTSIAPSEGYNFDLFCSLNEMGQFILIVDGLDEMRHKLSWDDCSVQH